MEHGGSDYLTSLVLGVCVRLQDVSIYGARPGQQNNRTRPQIVIRRHILLRTTSARRHVLRFVEAAFHGVASDQSPCRHNRDIVSFL